jgi:hypothetical protein
MASMSRSRLALLLIALPAACEGGSRSPVEAIDAGPMDTGDGGKVPDSGSDFVPDLAPGSAEVAPACTRDPGRPIPAADDILAITLEWRSNGVVSLGVGLPIGNSSSTGAGRSTSSVLESADVDAVHALLRTTSLVAEAADACPCPGAGPDETLSLLARGGAVLTKPIGACHGQLWDQLRDLWLYLRARYGADSACARDGNGRAPFSCHRGSAGGPCEGIGREPLCDGGTWRCQRQTVMTLTSLVPGNQCTCFGTGCFPDGGS